MNGRDTWKYTNVRARPRGSELLSMATTKSWVHLSRFLYEVHVGLVGWFDGLMYIGLMNILFLWNCLALSDLISFVYV